MSCAVGHRGSSDPALLWLWCRLAAADPVRPLAWELPYASGAALKRPKKKQEHSSETDLGAPTATTREKTLPWAVTTTEQRGGPAQQPVWALATTSCPISYPEDNNQHTQRKEPADLKTKNSLGSSPCGAMEMNPTSIHEDVGSTPWPHPVG